MDIQSFVSNHGTFTIVLLIIVVAYIGYTLYWFYSKRKQSAQKSSNKSKQCLDKGTQDKIANEIQRKLKEIDSCDCKDACKLKSSSISQKHSPLSSESTNSDSSASESVNSVSFKKLRNQKPEKFGNDDFY